MTLHIPFTIKSWHFRTSLFGTFVSFWRKMNEWHIFPHHRTLNICGLTIPMCQISDTFHLINFTGTNKFKYVCIMLLNESQIFSDNNAICIFMFLQIHKFFSLFKTKQKVQSVDISNKYCRWRPPFRKHNLACVLLKLYWADNSFSI